MKLVKHKFILGLFFLISTNFIACGGSESPGEPVADYRYVEPVNIGDGWTTGHLQDQGFNVQAIENFAEDIKNKRHQGIDSLSIARNGVLVFDELFRDNLDPFDGWINNQTLARHAMHSTSKSFASALIGIAIDQGFIANVDVPYYEQFSYAEYANWDERKAQITLQNVLTMRLGLAWDEWSYSFGDPNNSLTNLVNNNQDWTKALLDLPLVSEPGSNYAYNTAASTSLSHFLELTTGQAMENFAENYLFEPLQISNADWDYTPMGTPNTGSGLFLTSRDMAKFGQLYLDQGQWQGQQVISSDWVASSLNKFVELNWEFTSGYGYQWWIGEMTFQTAQLTFYSTRGYGGQFIILIPELDIVIAFTASNYENQLYDLPFYLTQNYILAAISE